MRIYLTGFSASGKSTVGAILAGKLKYRFVDVDGRIEKKTGKSIAEIFRDEGEREFRELEHRVIEELFHSKAPNLVIALGGGALQNQGNRKLVMKDGITVYLSCSAREIYRRLQVDVDRPLLDVKPRRYETHAQLRKRRIRELLQMRKTVYREADLTISTTDKTPSQAARELYRMIREYDANV